MSLSTESKDIPAPWASGCSCIQSRVPLDARPLQSDDRLVRNDLPTGTVTFLFTDVEGSTRLLHALGEEVYAAVLAEHREIVRSACNGKGGVEVDTQGDAFFFGFPTAPGALAAAASLTDSLAPGQIHVRVGLHTGTPLVTDEGYVGDDVHRAARIAAVGHGGQVLVSAATASLVELELKDLGEHRLKDLSAPERVYQLGGGSFPALKSLYRTNLPVSATPFLGRESASSPRSPSCFRRQLLVCSPSPGPVGQGRPGSHCRRPPSPLTPIPTASGGSRLRRFATRRSCSGRPRGRST